MYETLEFVTTFFNFMKYSIQYVLSIWFLWEEGERQNTHTYTHLEK